MTTQEVKRKLTAILSADVKGYSHLITKDEAGTLQTLNAHKEAIASLIRDHHGRVVDAPGDNLLAEFASVVDAVECGVEIQRQLRARNDKASVHRKMDFRIEINLEKGWAEVKDRNPILHYFISCTFLPVIFDPQHHLRL